MARLGKDFVREVLMMGRAGPRFLNENPIQISVWQRYAERPADPADVILTPMDSTPGSELALDLHEELRRRERGTKGGYGIAPLEGAVAVAADFQTFLASILPRTGYDLRQWMAELEALLINEVLNDPHGGGRDTIIADDLMDFALQPTTRLSPDLRIALLISLVLVAYRIDGNDYVQKLWRPGHPAFQRPVSLPSLVEFVPARSDRTVYRVSLNREIELLSVSTETIKADAAMRTFQIDCSGLTWAVIDSGIDGSHPAFRDHRAGEQKIRIDKALDFTKLRKFASYDTLLDDAARRDLVREVQGRLRIPAARATELLNQLAQSAQLGRKFDWTALAQLIEVAPDSLEPRSDGAVVGHGTHVAGVLAGDWREGDTVVFQGVCPTLRLYDLRVLGDSTQETEFAIIAALEYVRWLNGRNQYITIHGINLSIGMEHDLANYACGRTPVCLACESTISAGVTVVAAAGNWGSHVFLTDKEPFQGYAMASIADPGNAASVITVGSTHRDRPHEYGVSFFSSRGPTGDGRMKPDVVAPGERIDGPLPNLGQGRLDGTSMSAPHVSGVAALLMSRYPEMIGNPTRVKQVIVDSATDLKRERSFQGAGLVDALRALQSV